MSVEEVQDAAQSATASQENLHVGLEGPRQAELEEIDNLNSWFKAEHFLDPDFKADSYVGELRRYVPLDTLRSELDKHLSFLKSRLVEVINEDYNDFVSLSTKLVNVDGAVLRMKKPLVELREKLEGVQDAVQGELDCLHERLQRRKDVAAARDILDLLQDTAHVASKVEKLLVEVEQHSIDVSGASLDARSRLLERVASEVSRLNFYCNKGRGLPFVDVMEPHVKKFRSQLNNHLEEALTASLKERNNSAIFHCLHSYSALGDSVGAEEAVRKAVVAPLVERVVAAHTAAGPRAGGDMLRTVLGAMTDSINAECSVVLDIALNPQSGLHAFNFLANAVLKEVHASLAKNLSRAFSPGVPASFLSNYHASMSFLESLEGHCRSIASVDVFRSSDEYVAFLKRWNLSVYFSLRFQDVAGTLDGILICPDLRMVTEEERAAASGPAASFNVSASACLWTSLHRCLSPDLFVDALADRFSRLILQLLGRYRYWLATGLQYWRLHVSCGQTDKPGGAQGENLTFDWALKIGADELVLLRLDVCTLADRIRIEFSRSLQERISHLEAMVIKQVDDAVQCSTASIAELGSQIDEAITVLIADRCVQNLKLRGITATYRMTSRPMPTRPSHYVASVLVGLRQFVDSPHTAALPPTVRAGLVELCAERVSHNYAEMANDLLTTVRKTEDSLKRLKKGRAPKPGIAADGQPDQATDQDKICWQLFLDVQEYGRQLMTFQLQPTAMSEFKNLWATVAPADKQEINLDVE